MIERQAQETGQSRAAIVAGLVHGGLHEDSLGPHAELLKTVELHGEIIKRQDEDLGFLRSQYALMNQRLLPAGRGWWFRLFHRGDRG